MLLRAEKLNRVLLKVLQLAYLNFLWLLTTLLGLGLVTIGPATYAVTSVIRKWQRSEASFSITRSYMFFLKEAFIESMLVSWFYIIVGYVITIDLLYIQNWYFRVVVYIVCAVYLISLAFIFPILAHYEWQGFFFKIKMAFLFGFSYLQYTLVLFTILGILYFLAISFFPGILTFFGSSFLIFCLTWTANQVFCRIELEESEDAEYKTNYQIVKEKFNEKKNVFKNG